MNPRLLSVTETASYLGVSTVTIRRWVASGHLQPVRLPSVRRTGEPGRRLLFDVQDLDALVERWKRDSTSAPNEGLSAAALKGWQLSPVRRRA
jgi:excisionase family DNA binding protein